MSAFLTPYPPSLSSDAAHQPSSESTLSLFSKKSSDYFRNASRESSNSAYLTDVTPPITPSRNIYDRDIGKSYGDDSISDDPLIGPFKKIFDSRSKRDHHESDSDDDAGYITDGEQEQDTPLLAIADAVKARLNKRGPTLHSKCEVNVMEDHTNPAFNAPDLLDEPLLAPSMPAMKVVVTKAEEDFRDWNGDFEVKGSNDKKNTPLLEDLGRTPTQNVSFPSTKDQLWKSVHSEFEQAFHEGVAEGAGRSFFPDEIELHPANTFAFGTGGTSGWREEPASGSNFILDTYRELAALSPVIMPDTPVLHPLDESDWEASSLSLNSPSLVFDSSVSISQMLISPQNPTAPVASSPGVYDMSYINPNSPFNSPLVAISTLMFASRRAQLPPGDVVNGPQNLDLPALMRLEIAAALAPRQLGNDAVPMVDAHPRLGLGLEIAPSGLPESSFPSCNSLASIYSLPSWDAALHAMQSTSSPQQASDVMAADESSVTAASIEEPFGDVSQMVDVSATETRHGLTDISEESSRAIALASAESSRQIVGLGLGALAESTLQSSASISLMQSPEQPTVGLGLEALAENTLQSSASISLMHSPQQPIVNGTLVDGGLAMSMSMVDMVDGWYNSSSVDDDMAHHSFSVIESSGLFEGNHELSMVTNNGSAPFFSGIEPSGVLPDAAFLEPAHFSPGVENWLLRCSEVELSAPLDAEVVNGSPSEVVYGTNAESAYPWYSEIEPSGVLSEGPTDGMRACVSNLSAQDIWAPFCATGAPRLRRQSQLRESFVPSDVDQETPLFGTAGDDHRNSVSLTRPASSSRVGSSLRRAVEVKTSGDPIEEVLRTPFLASAASLGPCAPSKERETGGLGMGQPCDLESQSPRHHEVTVSPRVLDTSMMSTAEECLDLAKLSVASPTSESGSPTCVVSEVRGGSQFFFRVPKFARRSLSGTPEGASPLLSAWSDLASRLRSPGKASGSRFSATPSPPLAGSLGDDTDSSDLPATSAPTPPAATAASMKSISSLPQPPRLVPRQPRASWFARLSGSSPSPRSPGMIEHLDVPRGLGIFRRKVSPETDSPGAKKESRLKPMMRKLQLLF